MLDHTKCRLIENDATKNLSLPHLCMQLSEIFLSFLKMYLKVVDKVSALNNEANAPRVISCHSNHSYPDR
jgi:hypothetical protein